MSYGRILLLLIASYIGLVGFLFWETFTASPFEPIKVLVGE